MNKARTLSHSGFLKSVLTRKFAVFELNTAWFKMDYFEIHALFFERTIEWNMNLFINLLICRYCFSMLFKWNDRKRRKKIFKISLTKHVCYGIVAYFLLKFTRTHTHIQTNRLSYSVYIHEFHNFVEFFKEHTWISRT